MVSDGRRRFLKGSALAAGAFGLQLIPPAIRAALAVEPARVTGTLRDVEHIVVLMQENRSFDHYFGAMRGVRGFGDPRPAPLPNGRTVWEQPALPGGEPAITPFHLDSNATAAQCLADIDHGWKDSHALWRHHDAWMKVKGPMCFGHFTRSDLPFYYALADAFTVCDAYHCSIFGPTNPNRLHLFSGTSGLTAGNTGKQAVTNVDDGNWSADMAADKAGFTPFAWRTYAEQLQDAGVAWKVYQEYDNYGDNPLQSFAAFRGLDRSSPLYRRGRAFADGSTKDNAPKTRGEHVIAEFARDVREGKLPQVSWIVPPYIMSEHPAATPAYGESLSAQLLAALAANPEVWAKTVFIINYDENGGFFDHVPPPIGSNAAGIGASTVRLDGEDYHGVPVGLGPRVPMLVVSPWSRGGWVNSQVFDHTSVIRLMEERFGVHCGTISPWRRAVCGDLTSTLAFDVRDDAWPKMPDASGRQQWADASCKQAIPQTPTAPAALPVQEPGRRPARALPYALSASARVDDAARTIELEFVNSGKAGAVFTVYRTDDSDAGPWWFTVEAGKSLRHRWDLASDGGYAFEVQGPNGWLRTFSGRVVGKGARPEVEFVARGDRCVLRMRNDGDTVCMLRVAPGQYDHGAARTHVLAPGAHVEDSRDIAASDHWYDLQVALEGDASFKRRFAGHVETGRASRSDPALSG